jgi:murein DD-endopeptidase MepM/ murein hydrolase activator NlpD
MSSVLLSPRKGYSKASLLVSAAAAVMLAGCSNAVERFSQNPSDSDPVYTASVQNKKKPTTEDVSAANDDAVVSKPLASTNLKKPAYNYGTAENTAQGYSEPEIKKPAYKQTASSAATGGKVTVGQGMTLYSIAKSNGLTVSQLAAANRLKPPYAVRQGQVLRIPGAAEAQTPAPKATEEIASNTEAPAKVPFKKTSGASGSHIVASGDTLYSLGRKYGISPFDIAGANGLSKSAGLKLGQELKIPGAGVAALKKPAETEIETADAKPAEIKADEPEAKTEVTEAVPAPQKTVTPDQPVQAADAGAAGLRWPVRGKVISEFGSKPNGLKNEGINISVPEGTSVRAAGDGVVAYAGNELKGYGNLVLVRHAGGWVTAYAHAKELFVKRGDTVKRGDVIAKAGQTGSVSSPQLHFEVRKGAVAMDPLKYLDQTTASN